uniref:Uncharacterized protein n=1 Tax=Anguilla anguilla TaxID=7936 RepID=A0A0E9RRH4_ANGAN
MRFFTLECRVMILTQCSECAYVVHWG